MVTCQERRLKVAQTAEREAVGMSFTVPIIIMILTIGLAVLIYWGGFAEERRARRG